MYRLQYGGTVEANIYLRNVNKVELFKRVVDKQNLVRVRPIAGGVGALPQRSLLLARGSACAAWGA